MLSLVFHVDSGHSRKKTPILFCCNYYFTYSLYDSLNKAVYFNIHISLMSLKVCVSLLTYLYFILSNTTVGFQFCLVYVENIYKYNY